MTEDTHQCGEADTGSAGDARHGEHHREADGVDSDHPIALRVDLVVTVDRGNHLVDRFAGELVSQNVDTDLLVRRPERRPLWDARLSSVVGLRTLGGPPWPRSSLAPSAHASALVPAVRERYIPLRQRNTLSGTHGEN